MLSEKEARASLESILIEAAIDNGQDPKTIGVLKLKEVKQKNSRWGKKKFDKRKMAKRNKRLNYSSSSKAKKP